MLDANTARTESVLQIGAGGVGRVIAHKLARHNDVTGDYVLASRSRERVDRILDSVRRNGSMKRPSRRLEGRVLDADDVGATVQLLEELRPAIVVNAGPPSVNVAVMEACARTKTPYLDTSVAADLCSPGQQVPEAYDPQWAFRARFADSGITGILGAGFDPGVVSVFATYAEKHLFDSIDTIDVLDANAGGHGRKGDSIHWEDGAWRRVPYQSRQITFDFPEVGPFTLYSTAHSGVRSLVEYIPVRRIESWMGLGAPDHTGKTCIGTLVEGTCSGSRRRTFFYSLCDHNASPEEEESQAVSRTAGVPAVTAVLLYLLGAWSRPGLWNIEQLDPDPFLALMPRVGLAWDVLEVGDESAPKPPSS
jgi:carboxynorspermidine synthase